MAFRRPTTIAAVGVLVKAPWKRYAIGAVFVCLYAVDAQIWSKTAGEPYEWALEEQKRILREKAVEAKEKGVAFTSGQQDRKETDLEIDFESLPSKTLPSAWACAMIFLTVTSHILFHLMCHWSITFKAHTLFQPCDVIRPGCFVWMTPQANKGHADICKVEESEVTLRFTFTFQYQGFECVEPDEKDPDLLGEEDTWGVRLIQCPTNLQWREYQESRGLATDIQVEKAQDKYGTNIFELPSPTFLQLFKAQLTSPIAIFQFFCTALWMLDTYWRYTCFTLLSVVGFEASTAFQRLKSMATLRGMSTKSYPVYVYRMGQWQERPIEELLPGDIVSLTDKKADHEQQHDETSAEEQKKHKDNKHVSVPCDCLLIRGCAIVNEATLTGESVPQMKDALSAAADGDAKVDAFGAHRIHALFSGTSLIQASSPPKALEDNGKDKAKNEHLHPPDDGIVCYVLRTGFNSSQGELMRMIEFSTQDVSADKIETCCQLLFLLVFALAAAGYVLKKGLEDPTRPTYKTLLRCTLIITSVVPPSLPMQMAFAVHTALMSLLKSGIFCTEPFRVPYAGRVSYCFFDKTGTLTSDQMVAVGVVNPTPGKQERQQKQLADDEMRPLAPCKEATTMAAMVVAGCHSLIEVEGKAIGDPIEVAALRGVEWSYLPSSSTASPSSWRAKEMYVARQKEFITSLRDDVESDKKEKDELKKKLEELEKTVKQEKQEAKKLQVTIEQRFHFSSELQRMSTICRVASSSADRAASGTYVLTKGSPEAIGRLLIEKPPWYDVTYQRMAEKGQRVLALAYRFLGSDQQLSREFATKPRGAAEEQMAFAGFISFKCETRKDSMLVIKALQDSRHECVMLTGDAPLTALSVAQEVSIAKFTSSDAIILAESESGGLEWQSAITSGGTKQMEPIAFDPSKIAELGVSRDLVVTGKCLEKALQGEMADAMKSQLQHIRIFARLSPFQKESIIHAVKKGEKAYALMCGDGGNDVGALKEADVGLALLSGFGNANVGEAEKSKDEVKDAEEALDEVRKENMQKAQALSKKAQDEMARKRRDLMSRQQQWVEEELEARRRRGEDTGFMGQMGAMKAVMGRLKNEIKKEQELMQKKHGNSFAAGAAKFASEVDTMEDTPMVQLGDASTAAPFTTRTPSIGSCIDIIRQGRCTLLSAVQQMQIMMLESMISAYTMSTMSVDGTRPSEAQMMASGTLMTVASLAFSFARPVDRMHPVRPLASVFHPAILVSLMGQLLIHLSCMVYIASLAKDVMGEEAVKAVLEFEKERNKKIAGMSEEEMQEWNWFMSVPFKTNLLNTCCWLVETSQQIAVVFVNYKGRPWMKGLLENQALFLSLFICIAMVAICAWGAVPYLNELLNLEVVPEDLRGQVMGCLFVSLIGSFVWDRLCVAIFAPHIFQVMIDEAKAVRFVDFIPLLKTVGYVVGGGLFLVAGNPILWGLAFMMWRNWKKSQEPPKPAAAGAGG